MRAVALSIGVVIFAVSASASAGRPKVAVAPLDGDHDSEVSDAVSDAIDSVELSAVPPSEVGKKMSKLGVDSDPDPKELRKLEKSLHVVAIVSGKLGKAHGKKELHLDVYVHGKKGKGFTIEFKSATSKGFKKAIHDEVVSKVGTATEEDGDEPATEARPTRVKDRDADPETARHKPRLSDDDPATKRKPRDGDEESSPRKKPRDGDDESPSRKRPRDEVADADDRPSVRKRKHRRGHGDDDELAEPNPAMVAIRVGAGAAAGQRHLTFDLTRTFQGQPPTVSTGAASARIEGELYPFALSTPQTGAAGFGFAAAYDRTVGLSIKVPNMTTQVGIFQSHYALGARYRFAAGNTAAIAVGLDYAHRSYLVQQSGMLDMPDVEYSAIAPTVGARVGVAHSVVLFGAADVMLILDTGAIQRATSYGAANVYGIEGAGGVDIAFTKQIGLRIAGEVSLINFSFKGKGDLTKNRDNDASTVDVTGATDRSLGIAATLGLYY